MGHFDLRSDALSLWGDFDLHMGHGDGAGRRRSDGLGALGDFDLHHPAAKEAGGGLLGIFTDFDPPPIHDLDEHHGDPGGDSGGGAGLPFNLLSDMAFEFSSPTRCK